MKCLSIEQIYLYIEKELSPSENKNVESHLKVCSKCQKALEERRLLSQAAESLHLWETPPDFTQQVMARIFPPRVSLPAWLGTLAAGFASMVLCFFILTLVTGQNLRSLLLNFTEAVFNFIKYLIPLFVKVLKLASVLVTIAQRFAEFLLKGLTVLTSIISTEVQIIIISTTIILIVSSIYFLRRKLLFGEKT
jgi:hypothetical protein